MTNSLLVCGIDFLSVGIIVPAITLAFLVSLLTLLRSFKNLFKNLLLLVFVGCGVYFSVQLLNGEMYIPFNLDGDEKVIVDKATSYVYSYFIWLLIKFFQYGLFVTNLFPSWINMKDFEKTIENNISDKPSRILYFWERIFYMPMIWGIGFVLGIICGVSCLVMFVINFLYKTLCGNF